MASFTVSTIPSQMNWINQPVGWNVEENKLSVEAGQNTDWFIDPAGTTSNHNAPVAVFIPPENTFLLKAKVTVEFASTFDAGVLFLYGKADHWAKLCFEYSPQRQPMVVSVVTRGISDDCNTTPIQGSSVYLRIYRQENVFAFHYSLDNRYWHFARYFTLGKLEQIRVGFSAQSPMGEKCKAVFSEIEYRPVKLSDLRNGE